MEMLIVMVNGVFRGTALRVNDSSISHLIHTSISFPTLISFIPLFFYFIHLYFTIFCFISFPSASFRLHFASFRLHFASFRIISLHFASFRFISHHFASFRILVGPDAPVYWRGAEVHLVELGEQTD